VQNAASLNQDGDTMRAFSMAAPYDFDESDCAVLEPRAPRPGLGSVMSAEFACVKEAASFSRLRELLVERSQHCVLVVGAEGRPVGVVTQTDLLRALDDPGMRAPGPRAGQVMTALVFALPVTATIEQAAALMAYEGVQQIVVTGMGGRVAGIVRALDVARRCARSAGYLVDREE
jgi:CBS domain-containing protein